jgi:magnesium-transporting ATPase (P-type)
VDDQESTRRTRRLTWIALGLAAGALVVAILAGFWRRRRTRRKAELAPPIRGLSEAEAASRRLQGQDNVVQLKPPRSRSQILRENALTIFNMNLVGLAVVQFILGQPLDALLSLGVMCLNIAVTTGQELLARRRLREAERASRPQATVIREGDAKSIDPGEIVFEDMLVVGPGDQILVDGKLVGEGQIVVDESMLTGQSTPLAKRPGDTVYAGSFCVSGRGICRADRVGNERAIVARSAGLRTISQELTPVERIIQQVLRLLLILVAGFTARLLYVYFFVETDYPVDAFLNAAATIFGIASSGLFFMIILAYAAGTADLRKAGALVHRARSVESLAQATVVCFAEARILTGTRVEIEPFEPSPEGARLAESRLRQILGDYARSTSVRNRATRAMANVFEGSRRAVREQVASMSVLGWNAIAFDDDDLRGVYVIGEPDVLDPHLVGSGERSTGSEEAGAQARGWRRVFAPIGGLLGRPQPSPEKVEAESVQALEPEPQGSGELVVKEDPSASKLSQDGERKKGFLSRTVARFSEQVKRSLRRSKDVREEQEQAQGAPVRETVLWFAYRPDPQPLHDARGSPRLPRGLIPLGTLRYTQQVRPQAVETIRAFSETGVEIKVFASEDPTQATEALQRAGIGSGGSTTARTISGRELAEMDTARFERAAADSAVYSHVTPRQAGRIVQALRAQGHSVAVVGDGVRDLAAMREADLVITRQDSSQAALGIADIVLLENSPDALLTVLDKGQRIVNGLLDGLKLYLTQALYLATIVAAVWIAITGFPYQSKHASVISVLALALPSAALSLWASPGVLSTHNLRALLARFVIPSAVTMTAAALVVYRHFLLSTHDLAYAQLTVTYVLMATSLLLVVFVKPPWVDRGWRIAVLALAMGLAFLVTASIPLAQRLLSLHPLRQPADYLIVGGIAACWALVVNLIWWALSLASRQTLRDA